MRFVWGALAVGSANNSWPQGAGEQPWHIKKPVAVPATAGTARANAGASSALAARSVKAGTILVRQVGTRIHPGTNVGMGKDYTLFTKIDGVVTYEAFGKDRKRVSVYPPT